MNKINRDKLKNMELRWLIKNFKISSIIFLIVSIITFVIFYILKFKFVILYYFLQTFYIIIYFAFMSIKFNEFHKVCYILNQEDEAEEEADSDILQKEDD